MEAGSDRWEHRRGVLTLQVPKFVKPECIGVSDNPVKVGTAPLGLLPVLVDLLPKQLLVSLSLLNPFGLEGHLLFLHLTDDVGIGTGISNDARLARAPLGPGLGTRWAGLGLRRRLLSLVIGMLSARWTGATHRSLASRITNGLLLRLYTHLWTLHPWTLRSHFPFPFTLPIPCLRKSLLGRTTFGLYWLVCLLLTVLIIARPSLIVLLTHAVLEEIFSWPDIVLLVEVISLFLLLAWAFGFLLMSTLMLTIVANRGALALVWLYRAARLVSSAELIIYLFVVWVTLICICLYFHYLINILYIVE